MFAFLTYTITLGVWFTIGNIKFSNPNHRRFLVGGGTMVVGEQILAWHVVKQMNAQEAMHLASRQTSDSKNTCPAWAYPILSLPDTCSVYDASLSSFDLALALTPGSDLAVIPVPPEVCTVDDAPIPGTDLILVSAFRDDFPKPAFSVAPYNHNSLLPAAIPAVHMQTSKDLAPLSHSVIICLTCLSGFVLLLLFYFKLGAVVAPLLKGRRTSNKDAEYSDYHGEVFIWSQSPAGCTVTVVPKFDAFKLVGSTDDSEDPITDIPAFQLGVESDNSTDDVHDLYSAPDNLYTAVFPPSIETPDVHKTYENALPAEFFYRFCSKESPLDVQDITLDAELIHDVPYWENQSFVDTFREEMNKFLYPDSPLPPKWLKDVSVCFIQTMLSALSTLPAFSSHLASSLLFDLLEASATIGTLHILKLRTLIIQALSLSSASRKSAMPIHARVAPDLAAHPDAGIFYIMRPQVDPPCPH
ncbi:hypothetical protein C0993_004482 [Termitomyces sp. T159_Od127]|nr:hypothetical protein C0993_004482 [Termitomyces sp. T159_Od127]